MRNNKSLPILCSAVLLACSLCGCGSSGGEDSSKASTVPQIKEETGLYDVDDSSAADKKVTDDEVTDSETTDGSTISPAVWRATGKNGATVTFVGSMHYLYESDYPLPDIIEDAFSDCKVLAVEADITQGDSVELQAEILASMYYDEPGDELRNHISEESYQALEEYFKAYGADLDDYSNMKPWAVYNVSGTMPTEESGLSSDHGLDSHFLEKAWAQGKEVYEVESVEFQIHMMIDIRDEVYDIIFKDMKNSTKEEQIQTLVDMHDAWARGDIDTVNELSDTTADADNEDLALVEEFNNIMVYDRNKTMTKAAEELIDGDKDTLFIVGSAHYLGDKGILALLEKDGYTVERVNY